jgi:hypothetical protein
MLAAMEVKCNWKNLWNCSGYPLNTVRNEDIKG